MAEFALGLTKTAVEGTLIRVKTAIEEEAKLKVRVQNDLVFITCEFEMMQSFLNVTNAAERVKNELVRTWVRQLRDLAFDVEDCVEFVIHLDINKSSLLWRVVPSCMAPVLPLDEAVAEIKQLKARVEDLSQRNLRYNLITNNTSKISEQQQPATTAAESSTAFHILNEVWEAAGRRCGGIADLQKLITSEGNDLQVVSLWSGGSGSTSSDGTTSIIRKAYGDPEICKEFKSHAWVKLNHGLFNPQDFIRSLLFQFYGMKAAVHTEYHGMEAELIQQVKKQKYLVIVEQVSTTVEWDAIRMYLPDCKNGSRIVISTKQLGLATLCTGEPYKVSDLRRFTDDQHICAIFKKGCERRNSMGELYWQLRCRGTISVWGEGRGKSVLMDRVYKGIRSKSKEFKEVEFGHHIWIDVPNQFYMLVFARSLLTSFYSEKQVEEIHAATVMGEVELIEECCKFLHGEDCLVVINNLPSADVWEQIKTSFLSMPTKGCIVVITETERVAKLCVEHEYRAINVKNLEADPALGLFIKALKWTRDFELHGRKNEFTKLEGSLTHPGVISVWGIASVGKSALVRNSYYHRMANVREFGLVRSDQEKEFSQMSFTVYSWVDVPQPFSVNHFCRRLLLDFHSDDFDAMEIAAVGMMEGQDPIQECRRFVHEYKCFVVIDGLRSKDDWDLIRAALFSKPTTGCIVVITTEGSVARHCVENKDDRVLNVKGLESDTACHLFTKIAHGGSNGMQQFDDEMMKRTIAKCGGLPKAVVAEGYSRDASADITAEENGERLFSELMELSIIQQESPIISTKLISTCQVNGFFREYIISRPMEDNLVFALEGHCSLNSHRTGQHLTIGNSWDRDEAVFKSMDLSRLRSLTVFGEWRSFLISSSGSNMRLLRALDLEDTTNLTDDDLYKIGKLPPRLKFLSLRRCIHITFLPDSVGKLRQLQTLDVRGTSIVTMPESIINLRKLQYIRAGITVDSAASTPPHVSSWLPDVCRRHRLVGVQVPEEIGKLTALHTLGVINVAASGAKAFLPELKKLTQLRKLGVSGINKHNSKHFFAAISDHGHFESLSVCLNKDNNNQGCCLDGILLPLKNLRSLKLHGLNEKLPDWGSDQLSKLIKLDLEMATLMESDIEFLGKLPQLCILRIRQLQDPELHFRALVNGEEHDCYEKVKVLEIACSSSSSSFQVTFGCKAMKNLELFKVNCPSVSSFQFSGLEHLSQLTEFLRN
ncbi:hypothetical protein D1007_18748 [Hordeum vulgare]|nr:hypothetical protein D1007_18748 [Hordeum vulgare]